VLEIDPERKIARVQPGVILDVLRQEAEKHELTFAPDPSTHSHCTLGRSEERRCCRSLAPAWAVRESCAEPYPGCGTARLVGRPPRGLPLHHETGTGQVCDVVLRQEQRGSRAGVGCGPGHGAACAEGVVNI
jgi:hypothetical protein